MSMISALITVGLIGIITLAILCFIGIKSIKKHN